MYIMSEENFIVATNLSENEVYTYRLGASNSVGTVWTTNSVQICKPGLSLVFKIQALQLLYNISAVMSSLYLFTPFVLIKLH